MEGSARRWSAALAAATLLASCGASGRSDATSLELRLRHDAGRPVDAAAGSRSFLTASGASVVLTRALVTVSSVELHPCPGSAAARILRLLSPVGVARAHGTTTDRKLAVPRVHDVLSPDGVAAVLGTLKPLPGSYCFARVVFGPADADAEGAEALGMVGASLWLQGTLTDPGAAPLPFDVRATGLRGVDVLFPAPLGVAEDAAAVQGFTLEYGAWLVGVDLTAADAAGQLLANVAAATRADP